MSRMLDATLALIIGTMITVAYWFAIAGPLNAIVAAIDAAKGTLPSGATTTYNQLTNLSANIVGVWLICTTLAYIIMYLYEGTRTEDIYSQQGGVQY